MICVSIALTLAHVSFMTLSRTYQFGFVENTVATEYLKSHPKYAVKWQYFLTQTIWISIRIVASLLLPHIYQCKQDLVCTKGA